MKAELIANLIQAHCNGTENDFKDAIMKLYTDEERKGNIRVAMQIKEAYNRKKKNFIFEKKEDNKFDLYSTQSYSNINTPMDKDSLLELYEIVYPEEKLNDVILPTIQKEALNQIIEEQININELLKNNMIPSNRLLLCGPPGCGKTMTAKAIAHKLDLPMAYVRLDGLVSSYLGQTSTNLRKVFESVKNKRIVLFLDEFDAIAKKRDDSNELGELKRVVTTLLQNFDNMPYNIFLIAATNHQHLLDPAIWRRFNMAIELEEPKYEERLELIIKWIEEYNINEEIDYKLIAKITEGMNCAQIKEMITTVAKIRYTNKRKIETSDFIKILINQLGLYSGNEQELWEILYKMNARGVSLRILEKLTNIPHTTISYNINIKKGEKDGK